MRWLLFLLSSASVEDFRHWKMIDKLLNGFSFESDQHFYRNRFVKTFQYLTPTGGGLWMRLLSRIRGKRSKLIQNRKSSIEWVQMTIFNEIVHAICFVFMLALNIWILVQGKFSSALVVLLLNLIINLPAIFLQRFNRFRLVRIYKITKKEMVDFSASNST